MKTQDGVMLAGHYLPAEKQKRIILAFHGWRGNWKKDFAICAERFVQEGCGLFLVEQRAQGHSEGDCMGFGILERYDCREWTKYLFLDFGDAWFLEEYTKRLPFFQSICDILPDDCDTVISLIFY